eukprot:Ihof_evm9s46 gene=Ihof_evmTU9s46
MVCKHHIFAASLALIALVALVVYTELLDVLGHTVLSWNESKSVQRSLEVLRVNSTCPDGMNEVLRSNFNRWPSGNYKKHMLRTDFMTFAEGDLSTAEIVEEAQGSRVLRIKHKAYHAGCVGFNCPLSFKSKLGKSFSTVYYSMKLKFGGKLKNFEWALGGKLPGVCGGTCNSGGRLPNGFDGFSDRIMWREEGKLMSYVYHANMAGPWGDDMMWNVTAPQQTWMQVAQLVELNNPKYSNGKIKAWMDGKEVLSQNNVKWRSTRKLGIDKFHFSTFFGGNNITWAPSED